MKNKKMRNTVNAYDFFKDFDYKGYFLTHFRYMINPVAHIRERLLNNDVKDIKNVNKQKTISIVPIYLINSLENRTLITDVNSTLSMMNTSLSLNHILSVLDKDLIERIQ